MFLKSLIAACTLALGANAAHSSYADVLLRYDYTTYYDVRIYDDFTNEVVEFDSLSSLDDAWNLPLLYPTFMSGRTYRLSVDYLEDGSVLCKIERYDCGISQYPSSFALSQPFSFGDDEYEMIFQGGVALGKTVKVWDIADYLGHEFRIDATTFATASDRNTYFTIVSLEPVPVPASAALLFGGLGAFAFLRKRRGNLSTPQSVAAPGRPRC